MLLTDLEAYFIRYEEVDTPQKVIIGDHLTWEDRGRPTRTSTVKVRRVRQVVKLEEAQGLMFLCPRCFQANGGSAGTPFIEVGFEGRGLLAHQSSRDHEGRSRRWQVSGTSLEDLTLTPEITQNGEGCGWIGMITAGFVR